VVEEYTTSGLFPLSASFRLGEVADGEMFVSKLSAPMLNFPIARLLEETNDRFHARVELAATNVVGRYTHGEHKVCVEILSNQGRVNQVFEHAGVPYRPCLGPGLRRARKLPRKGNKTQVSSPW
jgi:hypothetical protein